MTDDPVGARPRYTGLAAVIDEELERRGWTWQDLATQTGRRATVYSKWKTNPTTVPELESLAEVSAVLSIPLWRLVEACGYPMEGLQDINDPAERAAALLRSVPDLADWADQIAGLDRLDQAAIWTLIDAYLRQRGGAGPRKGRGRS